MNSEELVDMAVNRGLIQFICKGGKKRKAHGKWLGGHRKGVMVAIPIDGVIDEIEAPKTIGVGFSLCKTRPSREERAAGVKPDEFDAVFALRVATSRALCERPMDVPKSMTKQIQRFRDRAQRYFQNATVITNLVFEADKNENTKQA